MTLAISIARMDSGRRFSTLSNANATATNVKLWDFRPHRIAACAPRREHRQGDLQPNRPLSLIGARAKMVQHWANRIDKIVASGVAAFRKQEIAA